MLASQTLLWLRAAWEVAVVCADADMVGASETSGGRSRLLRIPSPVIAEVMTISSHWKSGATCRGTPRCLAPVRSGRAQACREYGFDQNSFFLPSQRRLFFRFFLLSDRTELAHSQAAVGPSLSERTNPDQ